MEEKLIFLVYFFTVLNICVFNFSFSFFGEPELLEDTGKRTEKRTEAEKKRKKCEMLPQRRSVLAFFLPRSRSISTRLSGLLVRLR